MQVLSVGSVLSRTFSIWAKNFVPFTILAALVYLPVVLYLVIDASGGGMYDEPSILDALVGMLGAVLSLTVTGAITYGVFEQMRGRTAPIGKCLSVGLSRLFPILGVGLLVGLCVLGGFILLIIPGIILFCMLWLAVPVTVVEKLGVVDSMKRSKELTNGVKTTIFGLLFVLGLIQGGLDYVLRTTLLNSSTFWTYLILSIVMSVIFMAIFAVANAVAYHDIRQSKEGIEIEQLIAVFE